MSNATLSVLLFASPRYLKAHGRPRRVADLAQHALIATRSRDGFATHALVRRNERRKVTFAPRLYVSEIAAARRAAVASVGIALLPRLLCVEDLVEQRLVRVLDGWEGATGGVHLLHRTGRSLSPAARVCVDQLTAALPQIDPRHVLA